MTNRLEDNPPSRVDHTPRRAAPLRVQADRAAPPLTEAASGSSPTSQRCTDAIRWREAVRRYYDQTPARKRDRWADYYYLRIQKRVADIVTPRSSVLEIGCGAGELLASLKPAIGVGVDLNASLIREARREHPAYRFIQMAAEDVGRLGDTFDYVVISQTLGEIYDLTTLFRALQGMCHARTRLVVVHHSRLWQPVLRALECLRINPRASGSPEQNWIPTDELRHLLKLSGFETIRAFGMTLMPFYIPGLSAVFNRIVGNLPGVHQLGLNVILVARSVDPKVVQSATPRSVSIVVPARNEAGHIRALLRRVPRLAPTQEIIFVEGHSNDDTWAEIQRATQEFGAAAGCTIKTIQQSGKGKGDAVREGFAAATGDALMILDADMSVPPEELTGFFQALAAGHGEFINGSRMVYLMDRRAMRFLNLLGNKTFGAVFTYLLSQRFRDTLCGTKALLRRDYQKIAANRAFFGDFDPFGDFDLLFGAARANLKIIDLPVHYKARTYGETNISRFRHGWVLLRMCVVAARKLKFL